MDDLIIKNENDTFIVEAYGNELLFKIREDDDTESEKLSFLNIEQLKQLADYIHNFIIEQS